MLSPPANRGEEPVNPRTTPTAGLRPLNPCSAPRGDTVAGAALYNSPAWGKDL